jgi:hypothetical protein
VAAYDVTRTAGASKRLQGTAGRRVAREALRELVTTIADTAATLALEHPEMEGVFSLKGADGSDQTLIAVARTQADNAAPIAARFLEYNLPATFVQDLRSKADDLEHSIALQTEGTGVRAGSSASAEVSLQRITELVEQLNIIVSNKYRNDAANLSEWERIRHVERTPRSNKGNNNNNPTPPANE